jgi:CBS domain-containing protein
MYVGDLMERHVVTLAASDNLSLADDIMRLGRIRHMPVVSGERLVGILSQRDLFRFAISSALHLRPAAEREFLRHIVVREAMTAPVITVAPVTSIRAAVGVMTDKRIGCLPVVDDGRLVGLLSESDCMRYLARLLDNAQTRQSLPELRVPD